MEVINDVDVCGPPDTEPPQITVNGKILAKFNSVPQCGVYIDRVGGGECKAQGPAPSPALSIENTLPLCLCALRFLSFFLSFFLSAGQGAKATDNVDNDILLTSMIQTTLTGGQPLPPDTTFPGIFTVFYNVEDSFGNAVSLGLMVMMMTVVVIPPGLLACLLACLQAPTKSRLVTIEADPNATCVPVPKPTECDGVSTVIALGWWRDGKREREKIENRTALVETRPRLDIFLSLSRWLVDWIFVYSECVRPYRCWRQLGCVAGLVLLRDSDHSRRRSLLLRPCLPTGLDARARGVER